MNNVPPQESIGSEEASSGRDLDHLNYVQHSNQVQIEQEQLVEEPFEQCNISDNQTMTLQNFIKDDTEENIDPITYDEAINELGFGLFQTLLMQVCGGGSFVSFTLSKLSIIKY